MKGRYWFGPTKAGVSLVFPIMADMFKSKRRDTSESTSGIIIATRPEQKDIFRMNDLPALARAIGLGFVI